ncbi:hypothetical protein [Streptomyces showdoensis]|uniref:hypothetical protein n=1 Tax=Streptomyces showdoensis TaxID=68268 RepID=UPI003CD0BF2B
MTNASRSASDDRRDRIELTVYAGRNRPVSSVLLDRDGITLDARQGTVKVTGREVDIDATARVRVGGRTVRVAGNGRGHRRRRPLAVLKARLVRIN